MQNHVRIRLARSGDAQAIADLANELGRQSGASGAAMDRQRVTVDLIDADNGLDVLVAELDLTIVAYALHHIGYETAHGAKGRYLSDLFVAPAARRKGVATALIARIAKITRDEGGEFLWWLGKQETEAARALYARLANVSEPVTAYAATDDDFHRLADAD